MDVGGALAPKVEAKAPPTRILSQSRLDGFLCLIKIFRIIEASPDLKMVKRLRQQEKTQEMNSGVV